ncbi:MAG: hypothetical protein LUH42_01320 [Oscillospiraceae bacterium]|nr:hypothetical protein [Oscillospiraceae bacterium]
MDQEPNCKETGLAHYECSVCGAIDEDSYVELATNDEHSFSEWNIEEEATCISTGLKTRVCTRCSYTEYEIIPMTDHTYEVAGMHLDDCETITVTWVCSYCGDTYEETITGNFHNYVLVSDTATCTEKGIATYECTYCGDTYEVESEALGHAWGDWILSETYTQDGVEYGLYIHECTRDCCDNVFQQVVMPLSEGEPENDEGDAGETETVANVYAVSSAGIEVGESAVSGTGTLLVVSGDEEVGTMYVRVAIVYVNEDGEQLLVVNNAEVKSDMTFNVPSVKAPYGYSVSSVCLVAVTDDAAALSGSWAEVAVTEPNVL